MDKKKYVRIMIEAPGYEAKALADGYYKSDKYEVLERSEPKASKGGMVRIYLHIMKKSRVLGDGRRDKGICRREIEKDIVVAWR